MKKFFIIPLVSLALLVTFWYVIISFGAETIDLINQNKKEMSTYVGKSIVVDKDTQLIINYDLLNNEFITNQGMTLDGTFVTKQLQHEQ